MLGLLKTCRKLGLSFFTYLGGRIGLCCTDQLVTALSPPQAFA
jgi:hypothetical protein